MDKHLFAPCLFTLCGLVLFLVGTEGVVLQVCSTCPYTSIFAALSAVNASDTEIKVSGGNYTNEGYFSITFSNTTLSYVVPFLCSSTPTYRANNAIWET
jgi:hypothetical protein